MSDITKCLGTGCPYKESCFRYTATPNEFRQSYFIDPPIKDGKCEMFWGEKSEAIFGELKEIVKPK